MFIVKTTYESMSEKGVFGHHKYVEGRTASAAKANVRKTLPVWAVFITMKTQRINPSRVGENFFISVL